MFGLCSVHCVLISVFMLKNSSRSSYKVSVCSNVLYSSN